MACRLMPPSEQPRVFISYARKDGAALAQRLHDDLTSEDLPSQILSDARTLPPGLEGVPLVTFVQRYGGGIIWGFTWALWLPTTGKPSPSRTKRQPTVTRLGQVRS
jgi:hypothetical protein